MTDPARVLVVDDETALATVMLTARDEEIDKIVGLSVGADDYLVKPFSSRELIARIRAMLRRPRAAANAHQPVPAPKLTFADVEVDLDARGVNRAGTPVDLTRTEFDLLACMAARPRTAFSRRQLLDEVWGQGWFGDEHVVDVHVAHLRAKLEDDAAEPVYIRTVRGIGYGLSTP